MGAKKEYNCKKSCGLCCIVADSIIVYPEDENFERIKTNRVKNKRGKITNQIARKLAYIPEFKGYKYVCYYFDIEKRLCTIYPDRPYACKVFNCEEDLKGGHKQILANFEYFKDNGRARLSYKKYIQRGLK